MQGRSMWDNTTTLREAIATYRGTFAVQTTPIILGSSRHKGTDDWLCAITEIIRLKMGVANSNYFNSVKVGLSDVEGEEEEHMC